MKLLLLRDKKPGHFRQVEGLALVIARLTSVEVARLEVRPRVLAQGELRKHFSSFFAANPERWLRVLYRIDPSGLDRPDAIIGSGRPTISAGIMLSRLFGTPFIYSGRIEGYATTDVALQLVNTPRFAHEPRSAFTPIPGMIDPDQLPPRRMLNSAGDLAGARASLLIGGNAMTHRYAATDWTGLVDFVRQSAEALGLRWQVSTSRRSPQSLGPAFEHLQQAGAIDAFIDYRAAGAGSADALYGADVVVVTEDSASMVSEAIAAQRPVIVLRPARADKSEVITAFAARSELAVLPIASVSPALFSSALLNVRVCADDPRDTLGKALAPVLGLISDSN